MFFSDRSAPAPRAGNLIASGGSFPPGENQFDNNWNTVEMATHSIREIGGEIRIDLRSASALPWQAQISHAVMVVGGQEYTLCYDAKAQGPRFITAYMDSNLDEWRNISGGQRRATLTTAYRSFQHTFTVRGNGFVSRGWPSISPRARWTFRSTISASMKGASAACPNGEPLADDQTSSYTESAQPPGLRRCPRPSRT